MAQDALTRFSEALINEASDQKLDIIKDLQTQRTQKLEDAKIKMTKEAEARIVKAQAKLEIEKRLTLSTRETEMHQSLIQNRTRLMNEVFDAVVENIRAYVKTPAYTDFLRRELHGAADSFRPAGTVCTFLKGDKDLLAELCEKENLSVTFQESTEDFLGGFRLENEDLKLGLDCTLLSRLTEQKQVFYETSGLIIE